MIPQAIDFHHWLAEVSDPQAFERNWMSHCASTSRAIACLWQGAPGWSVPKRYVNLPKWHQHTSDCQALGIRLRDSGGGLVPQGRGILNLSLFFEAPDNLHDLAGPIYRQFCTFIRDALSPFHLALKTQAVDGSFCDGQYNLAVGARKVVGTAQAWRRINAKPIALIHAVMFIDILADQLVDEANRIEVMLGSTKRYHRGTMTSIRANVAPALQTDIECLTIKAIASFFNPKTQAGTADCDRWLSG